MSVKMHPFWWLLPPQNVPIEKFRIRFRHTFPLATNFYVCEARVKKADSSEIIPESTEDPSVVWVGAANAIDQNLNTCTYLVNSIGPNIWSGFLILNMPSGSVAKIIACYLQKWLQAGYSGTIDVDYYDGSWHDVYQGPWDIWHEGEPYYSWNYFDII